MKNLYKASALLTPEWSETFRLLSMLPTPRQKRFPMELAQGSFRYHIPLQVEQCLITNHQEKIRE